MGRENEGGRRKGRKLFASIKIKFWVRPCDNNDVLQMNSVLKDDFEKKMTVVGLLKQYAQQRDVDTFARGLSVILSSTNHQPLLQHIR